MSKMNDAELQRRLELLASVQPSPEATRRAMDRVRQTILSDENLPARKSLWRIIMESKWSKLAVAAAVILAVVIGLNLTGSRHLGGVAWSQTLQKVQQAQSCIHRVFFTISRDNQPDVTYEFVVWRSSDYGIRRDAYRDGKLAAQLYIPRNIENSVEIVPDEKKYVKVKLTEQQLAQMVDPKQLTELILSLQYTDLEPRVIEGKTCAGVEVDDPRFGKNLFEEGKGRLWADVATDLPVLMEFEGTSAGGSLRTRIVVDQFRWDPPLTPGDFEPNIPGDYTVLAEVDLSPGKQTLIKAFRSFARIAGGNYPSSLAVMTAMTEAQAGFLIERRKQGISVEQRPTKEELNDLLAIQGACTFYGQLAMEKKDVAYYGDKVTAEFPHAVLMRWRVDNDKYRVIFGDLTTQDVTARQLAEREAAPLNTEPHAIKPVPVDGTAGVATDGLQLKWLPGAAATEHRLYFGKDPNHLSLLATVKDAPFSGVPALERDTTYFWRVDEANADGSVTPGSLWRFSTGRLVGWWKLDETAGTTAADAGSSHHAGTPVGNPKWTPGAMGGALEFSGKGDYVDLGTAADFDITDRITVCAWIKVNAFDVDWQTIIAKGDTAWRLSRDQANNLHFACTGLWPEWARGSANVNDSQWHHVAGVYDGAEIRLYIDGKLDASAKTRGSINVNTYPVWIGENAEHPGRGWHGLIDDVRLYNYALSQAEIENLGERHTR